MHVVVHNAVSVDGRIDGFAPDVERYYELAGTLGADAHLVGADTLIEGERSAGDRGGDPDPVSPDGASGRGGGSDRPLLVVTDSRGRVPGWDGIRRRPFWRDLLVLCSGATPAAYLAALDESGVDHLVTGDDRVDL